MRREAKISKSPQPYLYDQYNVTYYQMANSQLINYLGRLLNSLMEGINKHHLPRHLVFLLDHDLLKGMKATNKPGISRLIGNCLSWLTKQIELIINIKKEEIFSKCMGALQPDEPNVIWIKILEKPNSSQQDEELRHKYNDILEETLVSRHNNKIMDVKGALQAALFDHNGHLTGDGKIKLWQEIDSQIQLFDKGEITLLPTPVVSNSRTPKAKLVKRIIKLPTPPPVHRHSKEQDEDTNNSSSDDSQRTSKERFEAYYTKSYRSRKHKRHCSRSRSRSRSRLHRY